MTDLLARDVHNQPLNASGNDHAAAGESVALSAPIEHTADALKSLCVCPNPIFIVGSPRSGTTALAHALSRHSQLWGSDETQILWDLFDNGCLDTNYQRVVRPDGSWLLKQGIRQPEFLSFLGIGLNAMFTRASGGRRWIDHTPIYALLSHHLANLFPGAYFVHVLRDGRSAVHSMIHYAAIIKQSHMADAGDLSTYPEWTFDFKVACETWTQYVAAATRLADERPDRCLTVGQQQLLTDTADEVRRIYDFVGLDHEESPIRYLKSIRTNSSFGVSCTGDSPPVADHRPWVSWTLEQQTIFLNVCGSILRQCGLISTPELEKLALLNRVTRAVLNAVPLGAAILIAGQADDASIPLAGRVCRPFPGVAGTQSHFANSAAAIAAVAQERVCGAHFLLFPQFAFSWLQHYHGFGRHLAQHFCCVHHDDDCILYDIRQNQLATPETRAQLER